MCCICTPYYSMHSVCSAHMHRDWPYSRKGNQPPVRAGKYVGKQMFIKKRLKDAWRDLNSFAKKSKSTEPPHLHYKVILFPLYCKMTKRNKNRCS